MSETYKTWEDDLQNEALNGITWHQQGTGATKTSSRTKLSKSATKRRERLISRIMIGSTLLYIVVALLYNYSIAINITLR